jgi:phosphohistidine swiveling domain-containing protein
MPEKTFFVLEEMPNIFPTPTYDFMEIRHVNRFLSERLGTANRLTESVTIYNKKICSICFVPDEFEALAKDMLDFYLTEPEKVGRLHKEVIDESTSFFRYIDSFLEQLKNTGTKEDLFTLWYESYLKYAAVHIYGWPHTLIDFKDNLFSNHLLGYLENLKKAGADLDISETFALLTTPTEQDTVLAREKADFKIILNHAKTITINNLESDEKIDRMLTEHANKYCWVGFCFTGPEWDKKHFMDALKHELQEGKEEKSKQQLKEGQHQAFKRLNIDDKHQQLFRFAQELVHGKEYRKDSMFYYFWALDKLIDKLAALLNIDKAKLRFLYPEELPGIKWSEDIRKTLEMRTEFNIQHITLDKELILSTGKAREYLDTLSFEKVDHDFTELKGMVAQPGKVTGKVKIVITSDDMPKLEKGDILVSISTNPDLVPAMKRAAAIITDVGGITSHAAIVSRELGVPCIVGTKTATKTFRDNDLVEVDTSKGIVKKLSDQ